ncbi:diacylglycerol/lipid kinase family protein [Mongoliimonas terrestris]|uniref:diacylglycerol/lipid kinase family protein n=1 Tax=Mongoliimonas terrestris TaxID=1709001 RepID=UPI0009FAB820|nr:diacylglycerol kinase family protein [Mongoliimonas terrestris]
MRIKVFLNRHSGTMRTLGVEAAERVIVPELERAGHAVSVEGVTGQSLAERLDGLADAARRGVAPVDWVVVGGGDGSVNTAAARLAGTGLALGILPLGTMNLFARSLGMPLDFTAAVAAIGRAEPRPADLAEVNGIPFVHQLGFGVQPRMARLRRHGPVKGRPGKLLDTARALIQVFRRPKVLHLGLTVDGTTRTVAVTGLVVSNSLYGDGHLPYADDPADGRLGIYTSTSKAWGELVGLTTAIVRGTWKESPHVTVAEGRDLVIEGRRGHIAATIDGELDRLALPVRVTKRPGVLRVLAVAPDF